MSKDLISRQAAIDALVKAIREDPYYDSNEPINGLGVCDVRVILNELPSAQPENKELSDWKADFKGYIDALNMPRDDYRGIMEYIDEVPSAQPTHNNTSNALKSLDCIDRQAAINEVARWIGYLDEDMITRIQIGLKRLPSAQPELCEYTVSAMAVEEMLKNLLPERGMWEIEGDEAKTAVCETVRDALGGLWKLPFVKPNSNESSLTQKALDTLSRQTALDDIETVNPSMPLDVNWVKNWVKTLPSAQPEQRWIPCKTALPEKGQYVLCQCRAGIMDVLRLTDDNGWYKNSTHIYMHGFVLAWCKLPEPWKEGEAEC